MMDVKFLVKEALSKLEMNTGYVQESKKSPAFYFAEIKDLGIKCCHFTEESAVTMAKSEASFVLAQELSKAKDILKRDLPHKKKRS